MLLSQVQVFLMVLETGSFTEAAFRLNVAQSSVSHSLSKLEKQLGVKLLQRDRSGVRLTPQGEALLPYFRSIAHGVAQLQLAARQQQGEVSGKVKIGSFPSTSCRILPRAISALKQQHPQVEVLIFEGTSSEVERWLDNHTVDLAFVELPTHSHFQLKAVFQDQLRLIVPHGHPLDVEGEILLSQISPYPYVLSKFGCEPLIRQAFMQQGLTLDVVYEVRDLTTLMALVEENIGVSLVPELLIPHSTAALASVPVRPVIQREVALAHHPEVVQTPQSRALAEQIFRVKPG
ncbi:LysR family transcriptional regulator [Deinococcus misasensis]|uniref:LysR family transcriptional regulator n=1 Tax=Deinococcus misasensis TaxID=392413 RepID=UPI00146FD23A|nr:LysR family transcriptional regulator [Deinococcus misasensis]